MKLICGLGNPGPKYETTRHNVGFLAVDRLIDRWRASGPTSKNNTEAYSADFRNLKVLLLKPQTYMNLSGKGVAPYFRFYQCKPEDLIVIHDDLDLKPMSVRLKKGGGSGGHNGLKSIDEHLGKESNSYYRLRIGIGHPSMPEVNVKLSPADYVLQPFRDEELNDLDSLLDQVADAVEKILLGEVEAAMNLYHRSK